MFQAIRVAVLAAFAQVVQGHVRALPTGANGVGCRECNGNASPGPFRVSGPLGGNKQFGANGVTKVNVGQEVELAIGYNGGHKSNTLNFFNVRYACGDAANNQATFNRAGTSNKDQINCNTPCTQLKANEISEVDGQPATAQNYPVDATQSKQSGYKVKFKIPAITGTGDARKCTFALVEGRNWGAGWDFDIQPNNVATTTQPPPAPPAPKAIDATFKFTDANCQKDAPGCLCLQGEVTVKHTAGQKQAQALLTIPNYLDSNEVIVLTEKNPGAWSANYILTGCGKADQELDITVAPNANTGETILNAGVISNVPLVCGSIMKNSPQKSAFIQPTAPQQQCAGCQDKPDWKDKDGFTCDKYTSCLYNNGNSWKTRGLNYYKQFQNAQGETARDGCCRCGGGSKKEPATTIPTPPPGAGTTAPPGAGTTAVGTARPGGGGMWGTGAVPPQLVQDSAPEKMGIAFGVLTVLGGMFL